MSSKNPKKTPTRQLAKYFYTGGNQGECPPDLDVGFYLVCIELGISPDELREWSVKDYNAIRMVLEARALANKEASRKASQ
ncbi:MAG: hypothetical protein V7641_817 [Blastocatellia bacterium]